MQAGFDRTRHHLMIGRMKLDDVAPKALGIEAAQLRRVLVGEPALLGHLGRTPQGPERGQLRFGASRAISRDRIDQRPVGGEQVHVRERRRLVENVMSLEGRLGHGRALWKSIIGAAEWTKS